MLTIAPVRTLEVGWSDDRVQVGHGGASNTMNEGVAATAPSPRIARAPPWPTCTRSWTARTSRVRYGARWSTRSCSTGRGRAGVEYSKFGRRGGEKVRGQRGDPLRRRHQLAPSCCSSPASATPVEPLRPSASTSSLDVPGVGENLQDHLEVYIQYASQAAGVRGCRALKWQNRPKVGAEWILRPHSGPAATNHFEGGGFVRSQRRVSRWPNLYVPLPAAGDPLRRLEAGGRATATRCTSGRCSRTPAAREDRGRPTRGASRSCASTTSRPSRTGASGPRRSSSRGRSSTSPRSNRTTTASLSPGPCGPRRPRRSWTGT